MSVLLSSSFEAATKDLCGSLSLTVSHLWVSGICATNNSTAHFSSCMEISSQRVWGCVAVKCWQQLQKSGHVTVLPGRRRKQEEEEGRRWRSESPHHGGLLRTRSSLPLRDQQAGAHPERPTGVHEVEPERLHSARHLVSRSVWRFAAGRREVSPHRRHTKPLRAKSAAHYTHTRLRPRRERF